MMHRVLLTLSFLLLIFLPAGALAQEGVVTGTISDSGGARIPGAAVEAKNSETGASYQTVSSDEGRYSLGPLPPGVYELTVSARGFRKHSRTGIVVSPERSLEINIRLEVDTIRETVTVSAEAPLLILDRPNQETAALQAAVSTIDRIQIEKQAAKTVMDALYYVPGGWTETRGRKEKQLFSVRGQRYPYPEFSIDGALFREFYEVPYFLSAEDVERIEVLRSSATLLTGISGLAGVIDITPRRYEKRETRWLAEYGSLDSYRLHVSHGQNLGDLSYSLGLGWTHTDGPEGRHGSEEMLSLFSHADWKPMDALSFGATVLYGEGERELVQAEPPAGEQYRTALQRFDPVREVSGSVKVLFQPKDRLSTQFILGYSNRHNVFIAETGSTHQTSRDFDHEWSLNLVQAVALSRSNVIRLGANYNHWVAPYGKRFYSGRRSDLETYSLALVDEHSFGRLVLDGGLRYQRTYINEYGAFNIDGTSTMFKKVAPVIDQWEPAQISGSLGATYHLTEKLSLRGNFLAGSVEPRRGTLTVNLEEPKTEHKTMVDAGLRLVRERIGEFSLTGFLIRQDDAIALSGTTKNVNGRILELYVNRDQDSKGLEFEFKSRTFLEGISGFFNVTAMKARARLDGSMSRDPEIPQVILGSGILGKWRALDCNFFWKFVSSYESARFAEPPVPQPLGDFHSLNLNIGYSLGRNEKIRAYLEITNLTDSRFSTVVGYPDYGRRFQVGLRQIF